MYVYSIQALCQNYVCNTAIKRCGIMAVLHITDYDVWPWPMTLTTNVATVRMNEKMSK